MRRRILASLAKSGYTAKDYVQDGLIVMWDGIENAGFGVHDPNATVIRDLSGNGRDVGVLNPRISIGSNYVEWDGGHVRTSIAVAVPGILDHELTVCGVVDIVKENANSDFMYIGSSCASFGISSRNRWVGWLTSRSRRDYRYIGMKTGIQAITVAYTPYSGQVYENGELIDFGPIFWGSNSLRENFAFANTDLGDGIIRIHRLSAYAKKLSTDEIAAIYAIDKARFGLVDEA